MMAERGGSRVVFLHIIHLVVFPLLFLASFSRAFEQHQLTGETVVVKGVLGGKSRLPCRVDVPNCGEVYFITWTKSDSGSPDSDLWTRIYLYSDAVEKPLRDLVSRAKFGLDVKTGGWLTLDKLRFSDETYYKCDVTYIQGKCPSLTLVRLEVQAAPGKSVIYSGNEAVRRDKAVGPLSEGEILDLRCAVIGGRPAPKLSWRQIDRDGSSELLGEDFVKNVTTEGNVTSLELAKKLSRDDLNAKFECRVEHEALSEAEAERLSSRVELDLNVGALELQIFGPMEEVKEGDVVQLQCVAHGSRPQVKISWINGSRIIENVKERYQIEGNEDGTVTTRSIIEIVATRFDHLAVIECHASNEPMVQPLKRSLELRVRYSPTVVMEPQTGLMVNESSDTINIYCTFNSNPPGLMKERTKWFKDGRELKLKNGRGHLSASFSGYPVLTISNVIREDGGLYSCEVANSVGVGRSDAPLELSVVFPPSVQLRVYPDPAKGIILKEGDDLRLICDVVEGNPLNVTKVKWIKENRDSSSSSDDVIVNETSQNEIVWMSIDRATTGNYSCQATNEAGAGNVSEPIALEVMYLPGPATIFQVNGMGMVKGGQFVMDCVVTELGKPPAREFLWELDGQVVESENSSRLLIETLNLDDKGNYSCAAVSPAGAGPRDFFFVEPEVGPTMIEGLEPLSGSLFNASGHSLTCRVECQPLCEVVWLKNGVLIDPNATLDFEVSSRVVPEEPHFNNLEGIISTLIWNMSSIGEFDRQTDNANFTCASTANSIGPIVESHTQFFVDYPPENLTVRPRRVDVIEGEVPPPIECTSDARPEPTYKWTFWNTLVADSAILNLNHTITREMAGKYTCVSSNKHGQASTDVAMNVLFAPECFMSQSKTGDKGDSNIILICEARANPRDELQFTWTRADAPLNESIAEEIVKQDGLKSWLVIPTSSDALFGKWTCSVSNSVGATEPNCSTVISGPINAPGWTMPHLDDDDVLLISAIAGGLVLLFIIILIVLFLLMRRFRGKRASDAASHHVVSSSQRENPDGSRSPTPSSIVSRLPFNQVITYKKENSQRLKRNDKVIDANKSDPHLVSSTPTKDGKEGNQMAPQLINKDMYENMAFHRKPFNGSHNHFFPHYQNIAQLTNEFRRTQSARYPNQPFGADMSEDLVYADVYDDVKSGKVADPRVKPPLPPKGTKSKPPPVLPPKEKKSA